jgi:hypothetical protein
MVAADLGIVTGTLNLGTYATGGVAVTGAQVNCSRLLLILDVAHSGGYSFEYVPTGGSGGVVKAFQQSAATGALTEVPNATNLGSINPRFVAFGN